MGLIKMKSIVRFYGKDENKVNALRGIDLSINVGELVAIVGPSGSGKTTLLNILGCLDSPNSGQYHISNTDVCKLKPKELARIRNKKFGFVYKILHY